MIIESALYQLLKNISTVVAAVGSSIGGGEEMPEKLPAVAYKPPPGGGRVPVETLEDDVALIEQPLQVISLSHDFDEAARLDNAIYHALHRYSGTVSDPTTSPEETLTIQTVTTGSPSHGYVYSAESRTHQFMTEYVFHYIDPEKES